MKSENEYADAITDVSEALRDWLAEQQISLKVAGPALLNVAAFVTVHLAEGNREEMRRQSVKRLVGSLIGLIALWGSTIARGERVDQPHH
jgi:predicted transcriptional regulator